MKNKEISFCIISVNCLHLLQQTLLQNITDNENYPLLNFIILDHNSTDGTDYLVKQYLEQYILTGQLSYYKTFEPYYNITHSLNIAGKLATGDIICVVYPGQYIPPSFVSHINNKYLEDTQIVLFAPDNNDQNKLPQLIIAKNDFAAVQGFDEQIDDYLAAQTDLINRLRFINIKPVAFDDALTPIYGMNDNYFIDKDIFKVFVNHDSAVAANIIVLFNNQHYARSILINNLAVTGADYHNSYTESNTDYLYGLEYPGWETGAWETTKNETIHFTPKTGNEYIYLKSHNQYSLLIDGCSNKTYYVIAEPDVINSLAKFINADYSDVIIQQNIDNNSTKAYPGKFGEATVFKNFKWTAPILV